MLIYIPDKTFYQKNFYKIKRIMFYCHIAIYTDDKRRPGNTSRRKG